MKSILCNKKGEGHIDTGIKIIIAIVIGAAILGGVYALFQNVILPQMNQEVEQMMHLEEDVQYRLENNELQYSYDGENWKKREISVMQEGGTIKNALERVNPDGKVLVVILTQGGKDHLYYSENGYDWTRVTSGTRLTLSIGSRSIFVRHDNYMEFASNDGKNWTLTATAMY